MARGAPDGDDRADPLAELNDAQRRAAGAGDGVVRVIAGAGSGKTRTLVHRVAHLLARGVEPSSIVLLTFTRRAAHAMLARAAALADDRARRVVGGTFHGFAHQLLRAHGERLGYGASFTVLDREDALDRVDAARTEFLADRDGGRKRRFPRKQTIHRLLSMRINTGRALDALLADESPHFAGEADALDAIGAIYGQRKRDHDVMDYDDLLVNLRDLLRDHDDVRAAIGRRLRHVLVDEYQDTNRLQAHITALLAAEHGNLMVVGDDAQSIYAFRGAAVRNILDFTEIFPDAETIKLERNYRSTQPVLDLANAILAPSSVVIPKRLHTDRVDGPRPQLVRLADEHAQADFVARRILALRESAGVALGEIAVLFRAGWHAGAVELALGARNIPFRKFGGLRLAESAHVKDVTALLRVALNPREASAWFRMLQKLPGIGPRTAQQLTDALVGAKLKGDLTPLREASPRARRSASALADFLDVLAPALAVERSASAAVRAEDVMPATDVASCVQQVVGFYRPHLERMFDDHVKRMRDLEALIVLAEPYIRLDRFLTDLAIEPPDFARPGDAPDAEDEFVTLSTIHSAKGLEWRSVFVLHLNDGQFPSAQALDDAERYEEERRLLYVAVTRAKRELYLIKPEFVSRRGGGRGWQGGGTVGELSPLLRDVDGFDDLVETTQHVVEADADDDGPVPDGGSPSAQRSGEVRAKLKRIDDFFGS